ncbi:MAG: CpaD family pilus assembly protein [Allosphingosinicella sp.]|uniref:CpaD family pilus assembly protein n=1 Tax=Allosphingosinicella sp. TaxID=2823234 RepID=UPI00393B0059
MNRTRSAAALLVLGLAAAGCAGGDYAPNVNHTLYSVNQPVVERTDYVLDVSTSAGGLSAGEQGRLGAWFDSLQLGYGDRVSVDQPRGFEDARGRRDVASVAASYGLLLAEGAPVTAGAVQPGSLRVIVSRTTASVPGCPNWDYANEPGAPIATSPNYGCASNSNLAAMVADPNDLVLGQTGSLSGTGDTATKAIRTHRNAVPSGTRGLQDVNTQQGGR